MKAAIFTVMLSILLVSATHSQAEKQVEIINVHSQTGEQVGIVEGLCGISEIIASSFLYLLVHPIEACRLCGISEIIASSFLYLLVHPIEACRLCCMLLLGDFYGTLDDLVELMGRFYEPLLPEMEG